MSEKISLFKLNKQAWLVVFLVVVYVAAAIFCLFKVNRFKQEIYDFPYTVSSEARIMQSRLYDFRNVIPVFFASKEISPKEVDKTLQMQEELQLESLEIIQQHYRGDLKEFSELRDMPSEFWLFLLHPPCYMVFSSSSIRGSFKRPQQNLFTLFNG